MASPILRWIPAASAVVVVAAAAIAIPMSANASSTLPTKTSAQVIALVAGSHVKAFSGTIEQTSDLGLPSLPTTGPGSDSSEASSLALITGTHSIRVYVDGASKDRVQQLDSMAEKDVIRNGKSVWVYDSKAGTAEHSVLAAHRKAHLGAMKQGAMPLTSQAKQPQTPAAIAKSLLASLSPTSTVTVGADVEVAGRTAYDLVLTPKAADTLIGSVSIAVDPTTGMPLGVYVNARGATTHAVSIAFSQLTLGAPAAPLFNFTPPANAKVTQATPHKRADAITKPKAPKAKPTVTGTGWDAVVTLPKQSSLTKLESSKQFSELTTAVSGGTLFHTSLVNILFTTDGRVIAGSVSASRLEAVAAAPSK
jgi:outer membrane lipoprotein-sorting protein